MKKIDYNQMSKIQGCGDGQDFLAGFLCVAGLLTITTGLGAALAVVGCGSSFGDWYMFYQTLSKIF